MKHFIIGTTAINRPMLHSDVLKEWMEWFLELDDTAKIIWFINIDYIEKLGLSIEDTKANLNKIIENRIEVRYLESPTKKGNFFEACKRIATNIEQYIQSLELSNTEKDEIKILWLEDDWKLNLATKIPIKEILECYCTNNSHTNLSFIRNNYIWALAPSILAYNVWKKLHYSAWINEKNPIDPEHCVGLHFRKVFGNPDNLLNVTVINKKFTGFNEKYMNYANSRYTYHDNAFNILENTKYVGKNELVDSLKENMVFIRITPSFCIDGCNYGRNFLEKYNLAKSHSEDVTKFYN